VWWSRIVRSKFIAPRLTMLRFLFAPLLNKMQKGDTIYIHNRPEFAQALGPVCRKKGLQIVLHMQNSHLMGWFPIRPSSIDVDIMVFCSDFLKTEASEYVGRLHTAVIPNGADDSMFYPERVIRKSRDRVPIILFASRLIPEKGPQIFLEAMRLLGERAIKAQGIIVGSTSFGGNKPNKFTSELCSLAPPNVKFHDYCSGTALADLFRKADIFCLPSMFNDPFPLAVLEAMACRLPVVATFSGGIPEALTEGGGLLVQRGSASELAAALEQVISEPSLREKMAEDGYASFRKNFTWPTVRERYHTMLNSLSA